MKLYFSSSSRAAVGGSCRSKNKAQGLLMSNHKNDDTFGPGLSQIFLYESRLPMLCALLWATTMPSTGTRSPLKLVHWLRGSWPWGWNRWSFISFCRVLEEGSFGWYLKWKAIFRQEAIFLRRSLRWCWASVLQRKFSAATMAFLKTGRILCCWNPRSRR